MKNEDDDLEIDDILSRMKNDGPRRKKVNGKRKGNRVELELCKLLTDEFEVDFSRSVGSGALSTRRWGHMPEHAKATLTGDICVPEKFKWVVECKGGYDDNVDFSSVMEDGCACIDNFIKQSNRDAATSGRLPIIMWKRSRQPWLAILRYEDAAGIELKHYMRYDDWIVVSLKKLLSNTPREFWFVA